MRAQDLPPVDYAHFDAYIGYFDYSIRYLRGLARERGCNLPRYAKKSEIIIALCEHDYGPRE